MKKYLVTLIMFLVLVSCGENVMIKDDDRTIVSGQIIDNVSLKPVEGAIVSLGTYSISDYSYVTGIDGNYYLDDVSARGERYLKVTKKGYKEYEEEVRILPGVLVFDVILERLPALRVDTGGLWEDELDFGTAVGSTSRSFSIYNDSDRAVEWEIAYSCDWIVSVSPDSGVLRGGSSNVVIVVIDRSKLTSGRNESVINVVSKDGEGTIVKIEAFR